MSLLDLKTDLKSLKYGSDRPGGGNSGQPYQKVDINTVDSGFNRLRMTKFDDGLVRGGVVGAANAAVVDTLRIGKFLKDFPKGPLFIVKQVGLQLSNPALETKKITIGNGRGILGFIGNTLSAINNALGPTRIYNLGINTIAQVPVGAFGIHFNRHGLLPIQDDQTKYLAVAQFNNEGGGSPNNRLVGYKSKFKLGDFQVNQNKNINIPGIGTRVFNIIRSLGVNIPNPAKDPTQLIISKYIGGPGSVYGIGNTIIQRYNFTDDSDKRTKALEKSKAVAGNSYLTLRPIEINNNANLYPISSKYTGSIFISSLLFDQNERLNDDGNLRSTLNDFIGSIKDYHGINKDKQQKVNKYTDLGLSTLTTGDREDIDVTDFTTKDETTIAYSPLATGNVAKYAELRKKVDAGNNIQQNYFNTVPAIKINKKAKKYNAIELNRTNDIVVDDDTLALQFIPLDPFTGGALRTLKFLGYITDYSENYDSSWNSVKYAGRNENFYIFNEFKRTATVGFNIPCFNAKELEQKHCDMSELASVLAGKYQDNLLLGGIITRLKVGRYINDQPGIITNLNFSPIQDSSWDLDRQLAFYLKVSFGFTLIHNFLPQYGKCGFIDRQPDPIPETVPEEDDNKKEDTKTTITIKDIAPTFIDSTLNANIAATEQRAEFDKDKYITPTKAQVETQRKLLNSLPSSN
jgi:hypothetical protein